eukprot:CAMPEP_0206135900 /NCGR_PEP_ID=MMETSP1473-20131121/1161_1 /ASSEMBLY_ACC=CAM_ASM_001109 /TAXON_ID=1461547 /ORGANISM="Stichococcus sp, Strain RCC1054" /LENGTH=65 /DNA_ID=CAMNT_0053528061 /DNA_START=107 /DNA_END=301 /DNA_ORIENTATION=-
MECHEGHHSSAIIISSNQQAKFFETKQMSGTYATKMTTSDQRCRPSEGGWVGLTMGKKPPVPLVE